MDLLGRTELARTSLLEQTLLSLICLPGRIELLLTSLKPDLRKKITMGVSEIAVGIKNR